MEGLVPRTESLSGETLLMPSAGLPLHYGVVARASRPGPLPFVLKAGETFGVFTATGDIRRQAGDLGIFHEGARQLSRLELLLWGQRPLLLSSTVREDNCMLVADLANPATDQTAVSDGTVHIRRTSLLAAASFHQQLVVTNYADCSITVPICLQFDADFHDIFEERGMLRARRGEVHRRVHDGSVVLGYRGLDGRERSTIVRLDDRAARLAADAAVIDLQIGPRQAARVCCCVDFRQPPPDGLPDARFDAAVRRTVARFRSARRSAAAIDTSNPQFNQWLHRSFSDIHLLATPTPTGLYPYAGVPWFSTPFGRDGLVAARQLLTVEPQLARGVLGYLAARQATGVDAATDAEPGKILHESRLGEMAAVGEIPFGRYYGSIDATPLFLLLAGDYLRRTADLAFIESLWPQLEAAAAWMLACGDRDGDGFIEYQRAADTGLRNQGWKDSWDSVSHADGRLAEGPIALCEVQAYAYTALQATATISLAVGRSQQAAVFRGQAARLRQRFSECFWKPSLGGFALALDGDKQPCLVRSSNAGHCLFAGIASAEQAAGVARSLLGPGLFNGFGIRTLDEREARYNPMSYHNGSVWPHDNSLIALGLARYGFKDEVLRILQGQFEASLFVPLHRLPELFCGFARREDEGPTLYPVACMPQAWASGAVFALLEAATGLSIAVEPETGRPTVRFQRPVLPPYLEHVRISNLRVGDEEIDLELHRHETDVGVQITRRPAAVEVIVTA